jgi:tetratricopeptide (TPR) repeat protein
MRRADFEQAERLQPGDARISYVLGIEAHRRGDFEQARTFYLTALKSDPSWPGAALLLGLATLRLEPPADLAALPGSTPEIRATLAPIQTLMQAGVPPLGAGTALDSLWHGLGLIEAGDGSALAVLDDNPPAYGRARPRHPPLLSWCGHCPIGRYGGGLQGLAELAAPEW